MIELIQTEFKEANKNLALEEAILEDFLKTERTPLVRVWKNEELSAVLGRGEKAENQLHLDKCNSHEISVIRRVSGGGTVLHGPGNINLSFFLPYSFHEDLKSIPASYCLILGWVKSALKKVSGIDTTQKGTSDLCIGNKKFSGTAQARKRHGLLHHLTILVDFDLNLIPTFLKEPEKRPDYRHQRNHLDFLTNLKDEGYCLNPNELIEGLQESLGNFTRVSSLNNQTLDRCQVLAEEKYLSEEWNLKGRTPSS